MNRHILVGLLTAAVLSGGVAQAAMLAVSYSNSPANGMTFLIDEVTGTGVAVGPSDINFLNSLACDQNGVYWSGGSPMGNFRRHLITINPTTGAGSIGPLLDFGGRDTDIRALAFSPDNILYGMTVNDYLYSIDTVTGTGTLIGRVAVAGKPIGIQAMAFAPDGTLYGWGVDYITNYGLITIDPETAAFVDVNPLVGGGGSIQAMTFGSDGTLYGARDYLWHIDRGTGRVTQVGSGTGFTDVRGIAFPRIPEPSTFILLSMGAMGLLAYGRPKRRRQRATGSATI